MPATAMNEPVRDLCWICRERPVDADVAPLLAFPPLLCSACATPLTRSYDEAWAVLRHYLQQHWKDIVRRGSFDLSHVFGARAAAGARDAHLHFVKLLGCKLRADKVNVDLSGFADALLQAQPHPEITLLLADGTPAGRTLRSFDTEASVLRRDDEVYSAVWMHVAFPVAVKVCYLKRSAPVVEPEGFPWHPTRQRKIVRLSPFKGDTRPVHARRDLRM